MKEWLSAKELAELSGLSRDGITARFKKAEVGLLWFGFKLDVKFDMGPTGPRRVVRSASLPPFIFNKDTSSITPEYPFREKIINFRIKEGLSTKAFAAFIGCQSSSVGRWENGAKPHPSTAVKLAKALNVPVDVLMDDSKPLPESSDRSDILDGSGNLAAQTLAADVARLKLIAAELALIAERLEVRE